MRAAVRFELSLSSSRRLLILAVVANSLTAMLLLSLLSNWQGLLLVLPVMLSLSWQFHGRFLRSSRWRVSGLRHDASGWALRFGAGAPDWRQARLLAPVFCHRHLLVMRFHCQGRLLPLAVAITHDSCNVEDFRRLRVLSRHLPAPQLWAASR